MHLRRGRRAEAGTRLAGGQAIPGRRGVGVRRVTQPHADHHSSAGRLAGDVVDRRGLDARVFGEEPPLISVRGEVFVEEDCIACLPRAVLERKRDEVAEAAAGEGVLVGKEPVVRRHAQLMASRHRLGDDVAAHLAGGRRRHRC